MTRESSGNEQTMFVFMMNSPQTSQNDYNFCRSLVGPHWERENFQRMLDTLTILYNQECALAMTTESAARMNKKYDEGLERLKRVIAIGTASLRKGRDNSAVLQQLQGNGEGDGDGGSVQRGRIFRPMDGECVHGVVLPRVVHWAGHSKSPLLGAKPST